MPDKEIVEYIADLFKGFADPTRVHILTLLQQNGELCVTEIAEAVELSQVVAAAQSVTLHSTYFLKGVN